MEKLFSPPEFRRIACDPRTCLNAGEKSFDIHAGEKSFDIHLFERRRNGFFR